jgi:alcohol dehydrogenase
MTPTFRALQAAETATGFTLSIVQRKIDELPPGDVLVRVHYSSLNYKDALSASGNKGVTRQYPHTPGIDVAGVVEASSAAEWKPGDEVIVTGFDLGMNTSGGFSDYIRVPAGWVIRLPDGLSLRESMCYGTAGFTAGQCVQAILQHGIQPGDGPVVVTGATGGVGSLSVAMLHKLGYQVSAVSSKESARSFLTSLGAAEIIARSEMEETSGKALLKQRFAAAVDTVGGSVLTTVLRSLRYGGIATACGNVSGNSLSMTVFPFILRGVYLAGIASADLPREKRIPIWQSLAGEWKPAQLEALVQEVSLEQLPGSIDRILQGGMQGRALVKL